MQVESERESFAQTQESTDTRPLSRIIGDMELAVSDLEAWASLIETVGTCPNHINPAALYVVGRSISALAEVVRNDWERCRALAVGGPQ